MKVLAAELTRLRAEHQYRTRAIIDSPQGPEIVIEGVRYLSFCSNDYLGLANDPRVVTAFQQGAERYGVGSGASHLITGHSRAHHELEEQLAAFTGRPRALLFSTGYMANLGAVSALAGRGDHVYEDRLNHASLVDAAMLAGARLKRYPHNDVDALAQWLVASPDRTESEARGVKPAEDGNHQPASGRNTVIITDGVFSMDGDLAPLPQLAALSKAHDAWLMVDDAHGMGVLGEHGGGACAHYGLDLYAVPILVGTLGKAFGTFGAFVAGNEDLIEYLIQRARSYIYTTALPPAVAHATSTSLRLAYEEGWRRAHLRALVQRFRTGAMQLGLNLIPSDTPIQPVIADSAERALALSAALLARGIYVRAIRPPTVPTGTARLRITLSAAHSEAQVDRLLAGLEDTR